MTIRPHIIGNWKMNGLNASLTEATALAAAHPDPNAQVALCPPATLLAPMAQILSGSAIVVGGQDCHVAENGAHTGDVSAEMLADAGARFVIIGHSERRTDHAETSVDIAAKAKAAWRAGLKAIICVGETEAERDAGAALSVVEVQLLESLPDGYSAANAIIAYEPVWAIGTGRTPTLDDIAQVHDFIRAKIGAAGQDIPLLYGGSMKPGNAADILSLNNVNGGLVGGASLKASDFGAIVAAAEE